ncbi:ABC-2 type transporter-domain-containing protein [Melanogaster broomeanus]|nr:ABC-2 type transporter-domain-containing protein [Melanogaster broomeanus]
MHPPGRLTDAQLPKSGSPQQRPGGSHVCVPLDFLDPSEILELRRSLAYKPAWSTHDTEADEDSAYGTSIRPPSTIPGDGEFDFGNLLKNLVKHCFHDGIQTRELGVVFKDLRVVGVGARAPFQPTFGSLFSPKTIMKNINAMRHPPVRDILSGFEGVVTPGEMLLVLGNPGSGCSTFLKTLANQRGEYHAVHGDVYYDSFTPKDIAERYRGDVVYCPEDDTHFPTLTVEQTLTFAAAMRTPQNQLANQSREDYAKMVAELLMRIFGLAHARHTVVGDASIRGLSGGEKKRLSIAETLSCRSRINAWDSSTRGLDSSTALEFVHALRILTDIARVTTIVSICQAGEQLYNLFDKVCVINDGNMAYFGPATDARQYFIDMGYEPQDRQTTSDFLVAVTGPSGRKIRLGCEGTVPRTADEMAAYFKTSRLGQLNRLSRDSYLSLYANKPELKNAYDLSAVSEHARHAPKSRPYTISVPMQVCAVMRRKWQIVKGDWVTYAIQIWAQVFQGIIMGSVFFRLPDDTSAYYSRSSALFFALLFNSFTAMAEITSLFAQRPIVLRHQKGAMYYPFIESLAHTVVDIPITFITGVLFSLIFYFMVGLQQSVSQFFTFVLFVFTGTLIMKIYFRSAAASSRTESSAIAMGGTGLIVTALYSGYVVSTPSIARALHWITHVTPIRYSFESLMVNEFHAVDGKCTTLVPQGPGYENVTLANQVCTTVGSQAGMATVNGKAFAYLSYGHEYSKLWMNLWIVCLFIITLLAFMLTVSEFNTSSVFDTTMTLFKQGSRVEVITQRAPSPVDEEKVVETEAADSRNAAPATRDVSEKPALEESAATDIFTWKHIQYVVPIAGGGTRKLLDGVSGYVAPGKLTALMGESGAGKTTLLNVLAQRVSTGVVLGDRLMNGQALPVDFQAQTGYCQQMDTHIPESTVREALLFSANLRQPESVPMAEKEAYVDKCLKMCGLEAYADAIVGSLTAEYRKRTTIGVELAAKPELLLFLDEPTSGLDSQSAWAIMTFLRELADNGQAILCTIHQPSAELFQVFDRLLLLRKGGQTVYFGDIGEKSSTLLEYFEKNGAPRCDPDANPAEYMLDVIGAGATATSSTDWHELWRSSHEAFELDLEIQRIYFDGHDRPPLASGSEKHTEFATSWRKQVFALTQRGFKSSWRNPTYIMAKLFVNVISGLLIGFTFYHRENTMEGTRDKLLSIFMTSMVAVPLAQQIQAVFIDIRTVYEIRERPSRMYSWTALLTSQILTEIPWNIFGSSLLFICWYWTVGFDTSRTGYLYVMYCVVFPLYYTTLGQAVAAMAPTATIAFLLFNTLFSFVIMFCGVMQPFAQLGWWRWMYRVSPYTYLIEGLLGEGIGHQYVSCASIELVTLQPPSGQTCGTYMGPYMSYAGGYLTNPAATTSCEFCPFRTTDQYMLLSFNITYGRHWWDMGIMLGVTVFNVLAIFALTYLFRIRAGSPLESIKRRLKPHARSS